MYKKRKEDLTEYDNQEQSHTNWTLVELLKAMSLTFKAADFELNRLSSMIQMGLI